MFIKGFKCNIILCLNFLKEYVGNLYKIIICIFLRFLKCIKVMMNLSKVLLNFEIYFIKWFFLMYNVVL